jgi:hypothetical protein
VLAPLVLPEGLVVSLIVLLILLHDFKSFVGSGGLQDLGDVGVGAARVAVTPVLLTTILLTSIFFSILLTLYLLSLLLTFPISISIFFFYLTSILEPFFS